MTADDLRAMVEQGELPDYKQVLALADLIAAAHDLGSHVATGYSYGTITDTDHADLLASAERLGRLLVDGDR